jgi:hypothetical protein
VEEEGDKEGQGRDKEGRGGTRRDKEGQRERRKKKRTALCLVVMFTEVIGGTLGP